MDSWEKVREFSISHYHAEEEPFYVDVGGETQIFKAAFDERIPVICKGPTGCGKSRFVERMAYELNRDSKNGKIPLIKQPCHEDLTADDLKGRYLLSGEYQEGSALVAVKTGGILYLDEIVEARKDTTVIIHPLGDESRFLLIEKLGKMYQAPDSFMLVMSYNPGYQIKLKDLKQSTRQRFVSIDFDYAPKDLETQIVSHEAKKDEKNAKCN